MSDFFEARSFPEFVKVRIMTDLPDSMKDSFRQVCYHTPDDTGNHGYMVYICPMLYNPDTFKEELIETIKLLSDHKNKAEGE